MSKEEMIKGNCNECGYKANYIIDYNNYDAHGYDNFDEVPNDQLLCGACWDIKKEGK
jgi:hypothetical protein|tara:strand:- start:31 stop:201 length:171 start_codon:yes stop_codon:yes gene_type:complete